MNRIALQWAIAASLASAYGADRATAWAVAGELVAECPEDAQAAGEFFVQTFSVATAERLGVTI